MTNKKGRRKFGNVRRLPSGRFQARYAGQDGMTYTAPETFATRTDAEAWLTLREAEVLTGEWTSPVRGKVLLGEYAVAWVEEHDLGERTRDKYRSLLRLHIAPFLGDRELSEVTTEAVRRWLAKLRRNGRGESTIAGSYRLLRVVMNAAILDERIRRNPCCIKGADREDAEERPVASVQQVYVLAEEVTVRYRVVILFAAFTSLRWGELAGLRREDVDLTKRVVHVRRTLKQLDNGTLSDGPPKTAAGRRNVSIPPFLVDDLREHLASVAPGPRARLFTATNGKDLRRDSWHKDAGWKAAREKAGLPGHFHFHDLRHTGNHLVSQSGANMRELMRRMGHSSMRAAMIYLHATDERDQEIANRLDELVGKQRHEVERRHAGGDERDDGGPAGALASTG